ncbi:hypothetical protein BBF96_11040 [Anoxybacter fermentans]|uniref:Magnesium transporter MgtE intracellular domain-containing protein n=1 Tax=Anoxybacter fermentans TaxID=1323375 RepID=A0A3S9SZV4_9FIRM|nr:hypothetical protein [Anoxybacter fermentans]AZR73876.1 hypothetical protein BBF96_11040 [Anoxybacter fermentans]
MKNFISIVLILIIITSMVLAILHVTGIFVVTDYILSKAKENPKLAEWLKTHEEVVAMSTTINELNNTIADKDRKIEELLNQIKRLEKEIEKKDGEIKKFKEQLTSLENKLTEHNLRIKEMSDIYGQMEPKKAAEILQGLDNELIVQILKTLKKDNAAEIFSFFSPSRAAEITKKYTLWEKK